MTLSPTINAESEWVTLNQGGVPVATIREGGTFHPIAMSGWIFSLTPEELLDAAQIAMKVRDRTFTIIDHAPTPG